MGFIEETSQMLGITNFKNNTFCYLCLDSGVVVENYKKILEFSSTRIVLFCENNKQIEIVGCSLTIKELSYKELCIHGKITNLNII